MKKLGLTLAALLIAASLAACGSTSSETNETTSTGSADTTTESAADGTTEAADESTDAADSTDSADGAGEDGAVDGGWEVEDKVDNLVPDDAEKVMEKAAESYSEGTLEPIALLATQIVSGTNYAYLCKDGDGNLSIAFVYEDLSGNTEVTSVAEFNLWDLIEMESTDDEELAGGWTACADNKAADIPSEVQSAFDDAISVIDDVEYTPIAYLGSQVVAGSNYAVLCQSKEGDKNGIGVAFVYAGVDGTNELLNIYNISVAEFTE